MLQRNPDVDKLVNLGWIIGLLLWAFIFLTVL